MASVVSIIPIVLLFILMLGFKMAGHKSALLTLVITVLLALFAARHDCSGTCGGQRDRPDGMGGGGRHPEGGIPDSHHHTDGYLQL